MELPPYLSASKRGAILHVLVQPRSARTQIVGLQGNLLKLKVTAPPVDDRANRAVTALLAETVGIPTRDASVESGESSRAKRILLAGCDPRQVAAALDAVLSSRAHEPG